MYDGILYMASSLEILKFFKNTFYFEDNINYLQLSMLKWLEFMSHFRGGDVSSKNALKSFPNNTN